MTLQELYTLVVETTGLLVVTPESLCTAVRNCYADLTGRGYRHFKERTIEACDFTTNEPGYMTFYVPSDYRRALYVKVLGEKELKFGARVALTNPGVLARYDQTTGGIRSDFSRIGTDTIYYIKGSMMHVETCTTPFVPRSVMLGYYSKLDMPPVVSDVDQLADIDLAIREEYEDAVTLYVAYFYYSRFVKDPERIQFYLKQYKYLVEDLNYELGSEDMYNEDNLVIPHED